MKKKVLRISCCALIFAILLLSTPLTLYAEENAELSKVTSTSFYTLSGVQYDMYIRNHDYTDQEIEEISAMEQQYGLTKIRDYTDNYNCHSYAWYSQGEENPYWMNTADVEIFIDDVHSVEFGHAWDEEIIVYMTNIVDYDIYGEPIITDEIYPAHSGITTIMPDGNVKVTSKWGLAGLYEHSVESVPDIYKIYEPIYETYELSLRYFVLSTEHSDSSIYSYKDTTTHTLHCEFCEQVKGSEGHTLSENISQYDNVYHIGTCKRCMHADCLEGHNFQYHSNSFKPTQPSSLHTKTCVDCSASYKEGHSLTYQANGTYKCRYCGYITTSPGNEISSNEDELYQS